MNKEVITIIGHLSNVIGYVYQNKNYILLSNSDFNKSYALVSYNMINNYGYHNETLVKVTSFIKKIYMNEFNELIYEIDCTKKEIKEIYINDSCNLCTFIKKKYNLENIYDYPQFIIEYTEKEENHIQELFHNLFVNREISKANTQEMNILKNQIAELQKELNKLQCEEDKNILEDYMKKENFIKSKL